LNAGNTGVHYNVNTPPYKTPYEHTNCPIINKLYFKLFSNLFHTRDALYSVDSIVYPSVKNDTKMY